MALVEGFEEIFQFKFYEFWLFIIYLMSYQELFI